jgi:RNA polymerase sigma-70 factor (ECF subfamily)
MANLPPELAQAREQFQQLVADLRPELHRYCSRLVGSAIDGEDVLQEALAKAFYALSLMPEGPPLRPWLLRIAHNTGIDFLRRYERRYVAPMAELPEPEGSAEDPLELPEAARLALSSFLNLTVPQRSAVILKDVLDYSLEEIAELLGTSVQAVKASLVRGRRTLRALPAEESVRWRDRPETTPEERATLDLYVALFNRRDWDGLRDLLAEECRLDLVSKSSRRGKAQISPYFGHYANDRASVRLGTLEGRTVLGVYRGRDRPEYFVILEESGGKVTAIRDYRYAAYVIDQADFREEELPS